MGLYTFTSESVSEGHPDKVADQISDAILDAHLTHDRNCRVACETMVKDNRVIIAGEISSQANVDYERVCRDVVRQIGYQDDTFGFNADNFIFDNYLSIQSPEIAASVDRGDPRKQGAGDQGLVFGYACHDTPALLPAPIYYAHKLMQKLANYRHQRHVNWLRPDAKSQVSVRYRDGKPVGIDSFIISTQHDPDVSQRDIKAFILEELIPATIPSALLSETNFRKPRIMVNPSGSFVIGGPVGDCGLTGRKIIVDSYGGFAKHGGGAFSGKDPSKIDRSASYAARQVARSIVTNGFATHCEVQIAYAIGISKPTALYIDTFGTGLLPQYELERLVSQHFDLTPYGIINRLDLLRPIYRQTASYGHFGREDLDLPWESDIELPFAGNTSSIVSRALNISNKNAARHVGRHISWRQWAEQQSGYQRLKGTICQCGTEKCIKQSRDQQLMRAFLLISIFCDELVEKYYAEMHSDYQKTYPTPRLVAHAVPETYSASWLIYSRHKYDRNIDWNMVFEVAQSQIDEVLDFLSHRVFLFEEDVFFQILFQEIDEQFEDQHKPSLHNIFNSCKTNRRTS